MKILVVDDKPDILDVLQQILEVKNRSPLVLGDKASRFSTAFTSKQAHLQ